MSEGKEVVRILEKLFPGVYTGKEEQIQEEMYDEGIYDGNWDVISDFEKGVPDIRIIQEDEFDQHRDDDMPEWDDIVADVPGGYLFLVN